MHPRYTGDLDLFVSPSVTLASLIPVLGHPDFVERDQIVQLGRSPNRIDLLTGINGVNFEEAWETKLSAAIDGLPLFHNQQIAFAEKQTRDRFAARSRGCCLSRTGRDETKLITRLGLVFTGPPDAG